VFTLLDVYCLLIGRYLASANSFVSTVIKVGHRLILMTESFTGSLLCCSLLDSTMGLRE